MLLLLDDIHKKHLELLKDLDDKVLKEFCRIALDHLKNGSNSKIYQSAAQRLSVEPDIVQNAVIGIMHLFIEASKIMIPEIEFRDSIIVLGFNESYQEELVKCYLENRDKIRSLLTTLNVKIPHYHNLEWRLDVQSLQNYLLKIVFLNCARCAPGTFRILCEDFSAHINTKPEVASRSLRRPLEPKLLLKLQLDKDSNKEDILLEADPSNLIHLTEVLERALLEARSHHCRRIMRNVK